MALYLVDTIQTFHLRYVIEAKNSIDAMDEIVWNENSDKLEEFSQKYLGETIISSREITEEELNKEFELLKESNDNVMSSYWLGKERLINNIDYNEE